MKNFKTFLEQRDPELYNEIIEEGWRDVAAGVLGTAGALAGSVFGSDDATKPNAPTIQYVAPHHDKNTEYVFNQRYINNGGPNFITNIYSEKELNNAAKKFIEFSKTDKHKEILEKSGIVDDQGNPDLTWVPSSFGNKTFYNAVVKMQKEKPVETIAAKPEAKPEVKPETKPENFKYSKWSEQEKDIFVKFIKEKYNKDIDKKDFKTYRPIDVLKDFYGKHTDEVIKRARKAQEKSPNDSSVTLVDKLYDEIPVLFDKPQDFGQSSTTRGFCMSMEIRGVNKSICVIDPTAKEDGTLAHELAHAMQVSRKNDYFGLDPKNDSKIMSYLKDKQEIGARVSNLKKQYSLYTGEDPKNIVAVFTHLKENRDRYTKDVQQLYDMFAYFEKKGEPELEKFIRYIQSNYDKYVKGSESDSNKAFG